MRSVVLLVIVVAILVLVVFGQLCTWVISISVLLIDIVRVFGSPLKVRLQVDIVVLAGWQLILLVCCVKVIIEGVIIALLPILEVLFVVFYYGGCLVLRLLLCFLPCSSRSFVLRLTDFLAL